MSSGSTAGTSILGTRVARVEDVELLTRGGSYVGDLELRGAHYITFARSHMAHAKILSIDVEAARGTEGVIEVVTAAELGLPPAAPYLTTVDARFSRPWLAADYVRFVGEPVALVISTTEQAGADAVEGIVVDLDPLPVVIDPEEALLDDIVLAPDGGTNVVIESPMTRLRTDADGTDPFSGCDVVVSARLVNNKMAIAPIEPRAAAAEWDGTTLTVWSASQNAFSVKGGLEGRFGLAPESVRVIVPHVGGGFGGKLGNTPEELLVGWMAIQTGLPLKWVETRRENMFGWIHGRGQVQYARMGGTTDGRILAYELDVIQDCGAYASGVGAMMPHLTRMMLPGCYDIPNLAYRSRAVLTNTTPVGAFRGAGRPEAINAVERMVDLFAAKVGLDPVAVRKRNFVRVEQFPFETGTGATYDTGNYEAALDGVLDAAGYEALRAEQQRRRDVGHHKLLGIGIASYVEVTNPMGSPEFGAIEIHPDGTATLRTGTSPHGQGLETAYRMICAELTGIPIDRIRLVFGDTLAVPRGNGTSGSRSLQVGGSAIRLATEQVIDSARQVAASVFEAAVNDIVLDAGSGTFHVAGTPARDLGWADLVSAADDPLAAEADFKPDGSTFPFGAHVAVVEVDRETGRVVVERLVAVDDAGVIINPLLFEGQVHGGLASGIAQALMEEIVYDSEGNPLTSNFADYAIISAAELPSFELRESVTPTNNNPLGAKGVGEAGTIGATPAVYNAVIDALSHLGIEHIDLPVTPMRVWSAIAGAVR